MKHIAIFFCLVSTLPAQDYKVTDLGSLGGLSSSVYAINSSGVVVGSSATSDGPIHAVRYSGTGKDNKDLGHLGGGGSTAYGINDSGQIVGTSLTADGRERATRFSGTGANNLDLGTLGGTQSGAGGINNTGQIIGYAKTPGDPEDHMAIFSNLANVDLGTKANLFGNNNLGQIVGRSFNTTGTIYRATLFTAAGAPTDLGTLGGNYSSANDINDSGQSVGMATFTGDLVQHATRFSGIGSGNTDLGTLGGTVGEAYSINNNGQIVGTCQTAGGAAAHGFIYKNGEMLDLNDLIAAESGITIGSARAINNAGQIAATGIIAGKLGIRAFRLDPAPAIETYHITATASPAGKGGVKGAGTFKKGRTITLTATAKKGGTFVKWTEKGKTVSTTKVYSFKVTKARALVANFK